MVDHMSALQEFYAHFVDICLGVRGLEGCESVSTHPKNKKGRLGEVPGSAFPGNSAGSGGAGIGQCISASRLGTSGGWINEDQE